MRNREHTRAILRSYVFSFLGDLVVLRQDKVHLGFIEDFMLVICFLCICDLIHSSISEV